MHPCSHRLVSLDHAPAAPGHAFSGFGAACMGSVLRVCGGLLWALLRSIPSCIARVMPSARAAAASPRAPTGLSPSGLHRYHKASASAPPTTPSPRQCPAAPGIPGDARLRPAKYRPSQCPASRAGIRRDETAPPGRCISLLGGRIAGFPAAHGGDCHAWRARLSAPFGDGVSPASPQAGAYGGLRPVMPSATPYACGTGLKARPMSPPYLAETTPTQGAPP